MHPFRFGLSRLVAPRHLFVLAGLCAATGLLLSYATVQEAADRKLALRQGPPPAVAIEDYRSMMHRGPAGEVVLRARAAPAEAVVFTLPGTGTRALVLPLFPLGDAAASEAQGVLFLPEAGEGLPDAAALVAADPDGWVEVNGVEADAGPFGLMLAGALAAEGRSLAARATVIRPFADGRAAAFAPPARPPLGWALMFLAALGLLGTALVLEARGTPAAARRARAVPRPPVDPGRFAPLPQEDEDDAPAPAPRALGAGLIRFAGAAVRRLRALRTGFGGLRSSR